MSAERLELDMASGEDNRVEPHDTTACHHRCRREDVYCKPG